MQLTLNVYALPKFVEPEELAGSTAVVIDVLRASTTIVYALEAGARQVIPCLEIADALALAEQLAAEDVVLGGERRGLAIDGFQLGNSPEEYSADRVEGKTVILTTTNGTRALVHARQAGRVLVASFVNAAAIVAKLLDGEKISLLCAGTDGLISDDDVLLAGMLVDRLQRQAGMVYRQNAQAMTARESWLNTFALPHALGAEPLEPPRLAAALRKTLGARDLIALGLDDDIFAAAQIDRFEAAPQLDPDTFRIKKAEA
jgi:2-phosphosulfolactate phosphatase